VSKLKEKAKESSKGMLHRRKSRVVGEGWNWKNKLRRNMHTDIKAHGYNYVAIIFQRYLGIALQFRVWARRALAGP